MWGNRGCNATDRRHLVHRSCLRVCPAAGAVSAWVGATSTGTALSWTDGTDSAALNCAPDSSKTGCGLWAAYPPVRCVNRGHAPAFLHLFAEGSALRVLSFVW